MMEYNEYLKLKEKINFAIAAIVYKNGASFIHPGRAVIQ
jgi:hypothetical protein